jgi:hypothetical protein
MLFISVQLGELLFYKKKQSLRFGMVARICIIIYSIQGYIYLSQPSPKLQKKKNSGLDDLA